MEMSGRACTAALCILAVVSASAAAPGSLGQGSEEGARGPELRGGRQLTQNGASAATCEWVKEVSACNLEYFALIPEGELKDFYRLGETCSNATKKSDCEAVEGCVWDDFCFVFLEDEVQKCVDQVAAPGSLCSLFEVTDKCQALSEEESCTQTAGCEWQVAEPIDVDGMNVAEESALQGSCFASQVAIVSVEFATATDFIPEIEAGIQRCSGITNPVDCEGSGQPQG